MSCVPRPGSNDLRFFGTLEQRTANVAEMARRLRARSIKVLVYDEPVPPRVFTKEFRLHPISDGERLRRGRRKLRCNSSVCRMLPSSRQSHFGHLQDDGPLPASGGWKTLSVSVTDF